MEVEEEDIEKSSYHMLCLKLPKSIVQEEPMLEVLSKDVD